MAFRSGFGDRYKCSNTILALFSLAEMNQLLSLDLWKLLPVGSRVKPFCCPKDCVIPCNFCIVAKLFHIIV